MRSAGIGSCGAGRPAHLSQHQVSFHVLESAMWPAPSCACQALGGIIVMGAAAGLSFNPLPTIPVKVAVRAPCTVLLVKRSAVLAGLDPDDD
jgi:hypothetical protein